MPRRPPTSTPVSTATIHNQDSHCCDSPKARTTPHAAMIRRALDEAQDPMSRARQLGSYVEVMLATGDTTAARDAVDELRQVAATLGTPLLRAHAARAGGAVLGAEGDAKGALVELRRAFNEYPRARRALRRSPHSAAHRRCMCDPRGLRRSGDRVGRGTRCARVAVADCRALNVMVEPTTASLEGLTQREFEILRLLASGKTNRGIAQALVDQREDGREPREPHLHEARRHVAKRGDRLRLRSRSGRIGPVVTRRRKRPTG